jgi:2-haloacid dehalogenase
VAREQQNRHPRPTVRSRQVIPDRPHGQSAPRPRALAFDVFGTLVDWHGSIVREGEARWAGRGVAADWGGLARAWREQYQPALEQVRSGAAPWRPLDELHRESIDRILPAFGLEGLDEAGRRELNLVWHRLDPWPDVGPGLALLAGDHTLTTLSNGNVELLRDLAAHGGLPFDEIVSAEHFGAYKPDPRVYLGLCRRLGLAPAEVMLVAAHAGDLAAAAGAGLRTAFLARPDEWGPGSGAEAPFAGAELVVESVVELHARLAPGG